MTEALRRRDAELAHRPAADPAPAELAGVWVNTHAACQGPARLEINAGRGALSLRTWGPGDAEPIVWDRELRLYAGIATAKPLAFSARKSFGSCDGLLQGNLNLGLLVLGTYKTYRDGQPGYFSREFLARRPASDSRPATGAGEAEGRLFGGVAQPDHLDLEPVLGSWQNTDEATRGIAAIEIAERASGAAIRVSGSGRDGPVDWDEAEVEVYAALDETGAPTLSLLASYDFGFMATELQLRVPGGTLAVADFSTFANRGNRRDYFTREFFYRR